MLPITTEPPSHQRAAIARAERLRKRKPDDPEAAARVDQLRVAYRASRAEEIIRELVDGAPPLTAEQRERLSVLLNPPAVDPGFKATSHTRSDRVDPRLARGRLAPEA
jgi:hypothetical protein